MGYAARHRGRWPQRTTARTPSTCARCHRPIRVGDDITYSKSLYRWIHVACVRR